jgi:hypothetical protein
MVVEIDRNPGAYPDGNVAEVRLSRLQIKVVGKMADVRPSGPEPKRKRHLWMVLRYARLVTHLQEFELSSTSVTNLPNTSFTLNLVGLLHDGRFGWGLYQAANLLCLKEDSRINVINALWNYIKINGLQDKVDRKTVRTNDELRAVGPSASGVSLQCLQCLFLSFLGPKLCISRSCPRL